MEKGYIILHLRRVRTPSGSLNEQIEGTPYFSSELPKMFYVSTRKRIDALVENPTEITVGKTETITITENLYVAIGSHYGAIKMGHCPRCGRHSIESIDCIKGYFVCCYCKKEIGEFAAVEGEKVEYLPKAQGYVKLPIQEETHKKIIGTGFKVKVSEPVQGGSLEAHCFLKEIERLQKKAKTEVTGKHKMYRRY